MPNMYDQETNLSYNFPLNSCTEQLSKTEVMLKENVAIWDRKQLRRDYMAQLYMLTCMWKNIPIEIAAHLSPKSIFEPFCPTDHRVQCNQ